MPSRSLFGKFNVTDEVITDAVFRYSYVQDETDSNKRVLLVRLQEPWLSNSALLTTLKSHCAEWRAESQRSTDTDLIRVRAIVGPDPEDGFGIVLEPPEGSKRLSEIDIQSRPGPLALAHTVTEALHATHRRKVFHGHLRPIDIWVTGNSYKVAGFGYLP